MSCVLPVGAAHTTHAPYSLFDGSVRLIQHCTRHSPCFDLPCLASVALKGEMIFMATRVSCRACGPPWFEGRVSGFLVLKVPGNLSGFVATCYLPWAPHHFFKLLMLLPSPTSYLGTSGLCTEGKVHFEQTF